MVIPPVYMDHNSTTPCDPRVVEAMLPYFGSAFGNASSRSHSFGWQAEEAVALAREQVARLVNAEPREIVFTSGATEAINLALKGVFEMYAGKGNHIITTNIEHKAVLDTCKYLEEKGAEVTYLKVDVNGRINLDELESSIKANTILISIMYANNEIGNIMPVKQIGTIAKKHEILFFSDITQAAGKVNVNVIDDGIDLAAFSSHKLYGPKGVGALYVRRKNPRVRLTPQVHGGGHESGFRSGTLNVPGIVGFGKACDLCLAEMNEEATRLQKLRDKLERELLKIEESYFNGDREHRLPHVTNISFKYVEGDAMFAGFNKNLAVSSGSSCTSASPEPSHVLKALGLGDDIARSSLRFGLGRTNTEEQVDYAVDQVTNTIKTLRETSPLWEMYKEGIDLNTIEWAHH